MQFKLLNRLVGWLDERVAKPQENTQHDPINNSIGVHILLNVIQFGTVTNWNRNPSSVWLTLTSWNNEITGKPAVGPKQMLFTKHRLKWRNEFWFWTNDIKSIRIPIHYPELKKLNRPDSWLSVIVMICVSLVAMQTVGPNKTWR
jgi:hypothetical protein